MHFSTEVRFSEAEIGKLITRAVGIWTGGAATCYASVSCETGKTVATGSVGIRLKGNKTTRIALGHELMVLALVSGSAAKGTPIDSASVKFHYTPGSGFGGGSSVSATAKTVAPSDAPVPDEKIFPLPVEVVFGEDETKGFLKAVVERSTGNPVTYVNLSHGDAGTSAIISLKLPGNGKGEVVLKGKELREALAEELTRIGYVVDVDGIKFVYTPGSGFGGGSSTSAHVPLTRIPVQ